MIFVTFIVIAAFVVFFAGKLARTADVIDQNSTISPILIGFILALSTSLPELATGITSTFIGQPEMTISNVLGSNVFNVIIIAIINIYFFKEILMSKVGSETLKILGVTLVMYFVFALALILDPVITIWRVDLVSILILVIYIISIKTIKLPEDELEEVEVEKDIDKYKKARIAFVIYALVVLVCSIGLSIVADRIVQQTGLDASFVGAFFIGVATSLPELTSAFTLAGLSKYVLAFTSVLSSNLFNFTVLFVVDFLYKPSLYVPTDGIISLIIMGTLVIVITMIMVAAKFKNKYLNIIGSLLLIGIYLSYLFIGR